jgi:flagellar basal body-associated protein FliL
MNYSQKNTDGKIRPIIIVGIVAAAVLVAVGVLLATGTFKTQKGVVTIGKTNLCQDLIKGYNNAFTQTEAGAYANQLRESANAAAAVTNNQSDANCVYMQFTNALYTRNNADITKFATVLVSLSEDGKYVTGQLSNPLGINAIKATASSVTNPSGDNVNPSTNGNG